MNFDKFIGKKQLTIDGVLVPLPVPAYMILDIHDVTVVLLEWGGDTPQTPEEENRNILAFDQRGRQIWRIEELPGVTLEHKAYTHISIDRNGNLLAGNSVGVDANVDLTTGKVYVAPQRPW